MPEPGSAAPQAYSLSAPAWRPAWHHRDQLGTPGLRTAPTHTIVGPYAARAGAPFVSPVPVDVGSSADLWYTRLSRDSVRTLLGDMVDAIRTRRRHGAPTPIRDLAACDMPTRVTLPDAHLDTFVRALADPAQPLSVLAQAVPHGFRGERLLDMLWQGCVPGLPRARSVPLSRALWLIQVVGASDLQAGRARGLTPLAYTYEWTDTVLAWLASMLTHAPFTPEERATWSARWRYAMRLIDTLLSQSLLVPYLYYAWLVESLPRAPGNTRACLLQQVARHYKSICAHTALASGLVGALRTMADSKTSTESVSGTVSWLREQAQDLLRRCVMLAPTTVWVHPACIALGMLPAIPDFERAKATSQALRTALAAYLDGVDAWDAACWRQLDDNQTGSTALFVEYFLPRHASAPMARRRLHSLCTWACTLHRVGVHRLYVAAALVHLLDECQAQRLLLPDGRRLSCPWPPFSLSEAVMQWLDTLSESVPLRPAYVARLFGLFARDGVLSYPYFLQRLMARGWIRASGDTRTQRHTTHIHMRLLRSMPVPPVSVNMQQQRRFAIYGARTSESYEEATERRALRELKRVLEWATDDPSTLSAPATPSAAPSSPLPSSPIAFASPRSTPAVTAPTSTATFHMADTLQWPTRAPHVWAASPYIQARLVERITPMLLHEVPTMPADRFVLVATLLTSMHAMDTLGRMVCALLDGHDLACLVPVCHIVATYARVWDALDMAILMAERLAPYAFGEASVLPGAPRVLPLVGRGMVVPMARTALAALGALDVPVATYAPMPMADVSVPSCATDEATRIVYTLLHDPWPADDLCLPLISAYSLEQATTLLVRAAFTALTSTDMVVPMTLVTCLATLAGTAGIKLDTVIHTCIRTVWDGPSTGALTWTALVVHLVTFGLVDASTLLQDVLAPFIATAPRTHHGWPACRELVYAIAATTSQAGHVCSMPTLGEATWFALHMQQQRLPLRDGLLPLLSAMDACDVPAHDELVMAVQPHTRTWFAQWLAHPDVVWSQVRTWPADTRMQKWTRLVAWLEPEVVWDLQSASHGALSLLPWRLQWDTEAWPSSFFATCLEMPAELGGSPMDVLLQWDAPPSLWEAAQRWALEAWVHALDAQHGHAQTQAIHALARLVHAAFTNESAVPSSTWPRHSAYALRVLERFAQAWSSATPALVRYAGTLCLLHSTSLTHSAWPTILTHLVQEPSHAWVLPVTTYVMAHMDSTKLVAWLRAQARTSAVVSSWAKPLLHYQGVLPTPSHLPSPWHRRDACLPSKDALATPAQTTSRDPWDAPLSLPSTIPCAPFTPQATREWMLVDAPDAPWTHLPSERSYGDGDDAASIYPRMTGATFKRAHTSPTRSMKRMRTY